MTCDAGWECRMSGVEWGRRTCIVVQRDRGHGGGLFGCGVCAYGAWGRQDGVWCGWWMVDG